MSETAAREMRAPARVIMSGSAGRGGFIVVSDLDGKLRVSAATRLHPVLRVDFIGGAGETVADLRARADEQLAELALIAETVAQHWPRLDGETPDQPQHWLAAGLRDAEVLAWLEAGVPWAGKAAELRNAGVSPDEACREWDTDVTRGLAFARSEISLERLLAEVDR